MSTTTPDPAAAVVVPVADPLFTGAERQALAGFLSGYSGLTRDAYTLDLRQYTAWCTLHGLHLFAAKRVDIESFRGDMDAVGRARATIERRLCTIAGFYRYAVEEELLDHSPAAHVWRPRLDYDSEWQNQHLVYSRLLGSRVERVSAKTTRLESAVARRQLRRPGFRWAHIDDATCVHNRAARHILGDPVAARRHGAAHPYPARRIHTLRASRRYSAI